MKLNSIIAEELVFCDVKGNTREEIYGSMLRKAVEYIDGPLTAEQLLAGIIEREDAINIPYEGMALPHLRSPQLEDLFVIIGILKTPVRLKENDLGPSRLVVMSLISNDTSDIYLKALASFARFFSNPENMRKCAEVNSPAEFFALLAEVKVKEHVTAEDVMRRNFPGVRADDLLSKALDMMYHSGQSVLPVVDAGNRLLGKIDATEVLKSFVPEYLFMMDSLKFVSSFEMFDKFFKEEEIRRVKDFLLPPGAEVTPDTPLIQFTVTLARRASDTVFVVDADRKLCGVITIDNIIHKILRG
ncbi:MAG: PTS sugar transporter subunit IIA [Victivallaceae bacterium]|nr:PTS sugar transporter subunit IIA [Victivallaceae bacterium]